MILFLYMQKHLENSSWYEILEIFNIYNDNNQINRDTKKTDLRLRNSLLRRIHVANGLWHLKNGILAGDSGGTESGTDRWNGIKDSDIDWKSGTSIGLEHSRNGSIKDEKMRIAKEEEAKTPLSAVGGKWEGFGYFVIRCVREK
ncbi:hypothetical protein B9Z55_028945 [Caenorhabditis nigoni]|uniref:Uncharacterized protein n=1 Tax=Caenorhabditis nigoni TaxID=1611254 RepID=A0A2G5S9A6_9PELO|nr:hypothetical protein B9Z55_028945 [Caenorhabditis nigoni]